MLAHLADRGEVGRQSVDAAHAALQAEQIEAFGGEQFMSTEADVLGREIWRLMKQAERGDADVTGEEPVVRRHELVI